MDSTHLRLQFLDLQNANDYEKHEIEEILFSRKCDVKFPWNVRQENADCLEEEVNHVEETDDNLRPTGAENGPPADWSHQQYAEGQMVGETVESGNAMQRSMFPAPGMYIMSVPGYPPYFSTPYYSFTEDASARLPGSRSGKKNDKAQFNNQVHYYPLPIYSYQHPIEYPQQQAHHNFSIPVEQEAYVQSAPIFNTPSLTQEVPPSPPAPPIAKAIEPQSGIRGHEHLCHVAQYTLRFPKPKPSEDSVDLSTPAAPVAVEPSATPVQTPSEPVQEIIENKEKPVEISAPVEPVPVASAVVEQPTEDEAPSDPPPVTAVPSIKEKKWTDLFDSPEASKTPQSKPLALVTPSRRHDLPGDNLVCPDKVSLSKYPEPFKKKIEYHITDDPYIVRLGEKLNGFKLDHRPVNFTPRGLTNPSNYCYVNAILQALIACPSLFNLLKALPEPQDSKQAARAPILGAMIELVKQFPLMPPKYKQKPSRDSEPAVPAGVSFEPRCIYNVLDKIRGDSFSVDGRQEDAEEFLSCLLNGMNDEMFEILKLSQNLNKQEAEEASGIQNGDIGSDPDAADGWKVMGPKNKGAVTRRTVCENTPISEIFRGQLRSRLYRESGEPTDNVQPFFTLQLDVEKANSVKEALENLVSKDILEGMTCSQTNREIEAWTSTTLEDLPLTLVLHLKCFDYKQDGCSKIIKTVDFTVDLKIETKLVPGKNKYMAKQKGYKLVAVVYHDGKEATKGHYVTDAYHVGLGIWLRYDDGNVRYVKEEHVLKPILPRVPYLLVYRRNDTISVKT